MPKTKPTMALLQKGANGSDVGTVRNEQSCKFERIRLSGELFDGRGRAGESVKLSEIAAQYQLNEDCVLNFFREFQTLGMVSLSGNVSAVVHSASPKEMQEAYEVRAALEEVGGRAAARVLKGNTAALRRELDAMRAAFSRLDLDSFVEHDVAFHRNIVQASQNEVLLHMWESLGVDIRIRAGIGRFHEGSRASGITPPNCRRS
jgi:DNA-binding GntR family transcriptional regulator